MRRVRYGVGMSLDGFIADRLDGTSWMTGDPGYDSKPFFASIDTVFVGRRSESARCQPCRYNPAWCVSHCVGPGSAIPPLTRSVAPPEADAPRVVSERPARASLRRRKGRCRTIGCS